MSLVQTKGLILDDFHDFWCLTVRIDLVQLEVTVSDVYHS